MASPAYKTPPPPDIAAKGGVSESPPTTKSRGPACQGSQFAPSSAAERDTSSSDLAVTQDGSESSISQESGGEYCEVMHRVLFTVKDYLGASPFRQEDRIKLAAYPYEVVDSDRAAFLRKKYGIVELLFPLRFFQKGASVQKMQAQYIEDLSARSVHSLVSPSTPGSPGTPGSPASPASLTPVASPGLSSPPSSLSSASSHPASLAPSAAEYVYCTYIPKIRLGCDHYASHFTFHCSQCEKEGLPADHACKRCHDDLVYTHELDRASVSWITCVCCGTSYALTDDFTGCPKCDTGKPLPYVCADCLIISDIFGPGNPVFHCKGCGHCIRGDPACTKHCGKCNRCYSFADYDSHNCIPQVGGCTFCLDNLDTTTAPYRLMGCGSHYAHDHCLLTYLTSGKAATHGPRTCICPACRKELLKNTQGGPYYAPVTQKPTQATNDTATSSSTIPISYVPEKSIFLEPGY